MDRAEERANAVDERKMDSAKRPAAGDAPHQQGQMDRGARRQRQRKYPDLLGQGSRCHKIKCGLKPDENKQHHKTKRQRNGCRCSI